MAYPVVEGYITGVDSAATKYHVVTFPAGIVKDEYIFGFIAGWYCGSFNIYESSGNFLRNGYSYNVGDLRCTWFAGKALSSGSNYLTFFTTGSLDVKARWIVYRISGHGYTKWTDVQGSTVYGINGNNFPVATCPVVNDYNSNDYLWLLFVGYLNGATATSPPTDFGTQINNIRANSEEASIVTARRSWTGSQLSPGNWNIPIITADFLSLHLRVPPGPYPASSPGGVGVYIQSGRVGLS